MIQKCYSGFVLGFGVLLLLWVFFLFDWLVAFFNENILDSRLKMCTGFAYKQYM